MITNLLLKLAKVMMQGLTAALPQWSMPLPSGVSNVISFLKSFDAYLPVTETLTCLSLYVSLVGAFSLVKWTVKAADYLFDVIP